jgi:predicted RNase H-like nuclease (RuvC/YqgF family)
MADSLEVIAERIRHLEKEVRDCEQEHRSHTAEIKDQIVGLHKRFDRITDALQQLVVHDQKITTASAHIHVLEEKLKDYETVRGEAKDASGALKMVVRIVVGILVTAFMGLIIVKGK